MNRREFLSRVTAGTVVAASLPAVRLGGQPPKPKILLFGMTVIRQSGSYIEAIMPPAHGHSAFAVGSNTVLRGLGEAPSRAAGMGLDNAHDDLSASDYVACLMNREFTVGAGNAEVPRAVAERLPNILELARSLNPITAFNDPKGGVRITLRGGTLRLPTKRSRNGGTHGINWQFHQNGKPMGNPYQLTDLLVFDAGDPTMVVTAGNRQVTLQGSDRIWFFNVPITVPADQSLQEIQDAHHWFDLLAPALANVTAKTVNAVNRLPHKADAFRHPCATKGLGPIRAQYFPPDTDPCFIVSV